MNNRQLENPLLLGTFFSLICIVAGAYGLAHLDVQTLNVMHSNAQLAHQLKEVGFEAAKNIMAIRNLSSISGGLIGLGLLHKSPTS